MSKICGSCHLKRGDEVKKGDKSYPGFGTCPSCLEFKYIFPNKHWIKKVVYE